MYPLLQESLPYKEELLNMDEDWLMLMAIVFFVLILTIKVSIRWFIVIVFIKIYNLLTCGLDIFGIDFPCLSIYAFL